jgi:hypothetical protein
MNLEKLEGAMDSIASRRMTSAKALHLAARGAHVAGFVLVPDDGLGDVAIVVDGRVVFLSQGAMGRLMEGRSPRVRIPESWADEVDDLLALVEGMDGEMADAAACCRSRLRLLREEERK